MNFFKWHLSNAPLPRLKKRLTKSELRDFYTPISEEIFFVRETARNDDPQLHLLIQLKIFQRLGYFPDIEEISETIIGHLRASLRLSKAVIPVRKPFGHPIIRSNNCRKSRPLNICRNC